MNPDDIDPRSILRSIVLAHAAVNAHFSECSDNDGPCGSGPDGPLCKEYSRLTDAADDAIYAAQEYLWPETKDQCPCCVSKTLVGAKTP